MLDPIDRSTEDELIRAIDQDEIEAHVDALAGLERVSGTVDERQASEYIVETLREYGVRAESNEYEGYISVPESGAVTVTAPESHELREVITTAFSATTPDAGIHGRVVRVDDLGDPAAAERRIADAIVFTPGLPTAQAVEAAERLGVRALIFESPTEGQLHEMIVSPVWGTPSLGTAGDIPDVPVVEVSQVDGAWLRERLAAGPVEATVRTDVTTKLRTLPCPVGRIEGENSDRYFVMGNHVDSWYEGVTDNATAIAATLEVARVFAEQSPDRGLVFGFWSAHSTGRYAGSAWYADTNWTDLRENGVAYLHLDLNGLKGADSLWYQHMAEVGDEHLDAMSDATEIPIGSDSSGWLGDTDRPARNSDQSFWGTGLSSLLSGARFSAGTEEGGPIGGGWWWHTPEDTRDKVDTDLLTEETKLYVTLASRFCNSPVLPHDFTATVDDIEATLDEITDEYELDGDALDETHARLTRLREAIETANAIIDDRAGEDPTLSGAVEDLQVELGNVLIPALYMDVQEYEQEPAVGHSLLPYLRIPELAEAPTGLTRRFAEVTFDRGVNKLNHRLSRAYAAVDAFLGEHR